MVVQAGTCAPCKCELDVASHLADSAQHCLRIGILIDRALASSQVLMITAEEVLGEQRRLDTRPRAGAGGVDRVLEQHRQAQEQQWCLQALWQPLLSLLRIVMQQRRNLHV